jgi:gluconate:H+ symporter, GntP family
MVNYCVSSILLYLGLMISSPYLFILLIASIVFIVWITAYRKLNAFFALLLAALGVGIFSGLPLDQITAVLKSGFGHTMEKIGLLIILGTALGVVLEKTGATISMASSILRFVKEKNAPIAISLTGFIVGLPIFCDSGFIILSGLNHSLVRKTHFRMPVMASVLATSLYAVHCLVPPHPGISAATGTMNGDLGMVMLFGIVLAVPAAIVGYIWSVRKGRAVVNNIVDDDREIEEQKVLPSAGAAFLPVVLPILLIGVKSVLFVFIDNDFATADTIVKIVSFAGEPVVALGIGLILSFFLISSENKSELTHWLTEGVEKAGIILAIIAAGGMFGEMLQATGLGANIGSLLNGLSSGIFLPFFIAAILKTAQGSSTVAVITASSLVAPLLEDLGLDSQWGTTMAILSMGAGSMMISHANDAYFWVISRFSNLDTSVTLKVYTVATVLMAITAQMVIWLLYTFL